MLTIRFTRIGKKNQPFFRLIVCDKQNSSKAGKAVEILGNFNPFTKEKVLKKERIEHWLKVGAKPSDRVHNFLVSEGILKADKVSVHSKPKKKEGEEKPAEAPKEETKAPEPAKTEEKKEEPPKEEAKPAEEAKA